MSGEKLYRRKLLRLDHVVDGEHLTSLSDRKRTNAARRALFAANRCINGSLSGEPSKRSGRVHGPVVEGTGKCAECGVVAAKSRAA